MSETRELLVASAERLFAEHCGKAVVEAAERDGIPQPLWQAIEDAGFGTALVPESAGGTGVPVADALAVLRVAAAFSCPAPLAETMLARWLLARCDLTAADGPCGIAPVNLHDDVRLSPRGSGWQVSGRVSRVPWSQQVHSLVVLAQGPDGAMVAQLSHDDVGRNTPGRNIAGEPRDELILDAAVRSEAVAAAPADFGRNQLFAFGAALRTIQIAGALARVLEITVRYAQERVQFGRPIGKFQAIQQSLAVLAGQAAAAGAAADLAAEAVAAGFDFAVIGAAKARAGEAASAGAAIAHQVHGAIGFTREHPLNHGTRRLWSWRDEFGSDALWYRTVGAFAFEAGAEGLWGAITVPPRARAETMLRPVVTAVSLA
jgi:alkylation response protein AidB-like acyl-CoA dehydrogenase